MNKSYGKCEIIPELSIPCACTMEFSTTFKAKCHARKYEQLRGNITVLRSESNVNSLLSAALSYVVVGLTFILIKVNHLSRKINGYRSHSSDDSSPIHVV